jgi:hypothetical protein
MGNPVQAEGAAQGENVLDCFVPRNDGSIIVLHTLNAFLRFLFIRENATSPSRECDLTFARRRHRIRENATSRLREGDLAFARRRPRVREKATSRSPEGDLAFARMRPRAREKATSHSREGDLAKQRTPSCKRKLISSLY